MTSDSTTSRFLTAGATLAGFALLTNWPWEFLQVPLYAGMATAPHWEATLLCTLATIGDAFIMCLAFLVVSLATRSRTWLQHGDRRTQAAFVAAAFLISMTFEVVNIYVLARWSYAPAMPQAVGLGLSPVVQWLLLPPLTLWLVGRHLRGSA